VVAVSFIFCCLRYPSDESILEYANYLTGTCYQ